MKIFYLHSHKAHGVECRWFEVDDVVYGLNSERGITDRYGEELEFIDASVAAAILQMDALMHPKQEAA